MLSIESSFSKTDRECCPMFGVSNWWSDFEKAIVLLKGVNEIPGDSISTCGKIESACDVANEIFSFTEYIRWTVSIEFLCYCDITWNFVNSKF